MNKTASQIADDVLVKIALSGKTIIDAYQKAGDKGEAFSSLMRRAPRATSIGEDLLSHLGGQIPGARSVLAHRTPGEMMRSLSQFDRPNLSGDALRKLFPR